jgi:hypothetical protein
MICDCAKYLSNSLKSNKWMSIDLNKQYQLNKYELAVEKDRVWVPNGILSPAMQMELKTVKAISETISIDLDTELQYLKEKFNERLISYPRGWCFCYYFDQHGEQELHLYGFRSTKRTESIGGVNRNATILNIMEARKKINNAPLTFAKLNPETGDPQGFNSYAWWTHGVPAGLQTIVERINISSGKVEALEYFDAISGIFQGEKPGGKDGKHGSGCGNTISTIIDCPQPPPPADLKEYIHRLQDGTIISKKRLDEVVHNWNNREMNHSNSSTFDPFPDNITILE